jgi:hypothetical protein
MKTNTLLIVTPRRFTLIVYLLMILTPWMLLSHHGHAEVSKTDQTKLKLHKLYSLINMYYALFGVYPSNEEGLAILQNPPRGKKSLLTYIPKDSWGEPFVYHKLDDHNSHPFIIYSKGKDQQKGTTCDLYVNNYVPTTVLKSCVVHLKHKRWFMLGIMICGIFIGLIGMRAMRNKSQAK